MPLSDAEYHAKSNALLARLEAQIDAWLDDDVVDIDTHRTGGLLELSMPGGKFRFLNGIVVSLSEVGQVHGPRGTVAFVRYRLEVRESTGG